MVDGGEPGVDSRDEGKHTGRNDLLLVISMPTTDDGRCRRVSGAGHVDVWPAVLNAAASAIYALVCRRCDMCFRF